MRKGRQWALMGQGPCGGPLRLDFLRSTDSNPFRPRTPSVQQNAHGVPGRRRAGKALVLTLPVGARRRATSRGLARAARRTARPAKGQAAALRWGALAGACTRARVLVHGSVTRSSGDQRHSSTRPTQLGVASRAITCKKPNSGRSPAHTQHPSRAATASSGA
jgi:hypothetical protein